jgi:hypothetical protein
VEPILIGTGLFILGAVVWIVCAVYAYRMAPTLGRNAVTWGVLTIILGPFGLFALYLLPNKAAKSGHGQRREDPHAALYEKPRKR